MHHELKCWPAFFHAVVDGTKTFELRDNTDRGFQAGDTVALHLYDPARRCYVNPNGGVTSDPASADSLTFHIGYVLPVDDKRVVFSLLKAYPHD